MKIIFINTLRILMILVIMISCGVAYVVYEDTLAAWWIPVGVALIIVIATIPFYKGWIWLTTMDNKVISRPLKSTHLRDIARKQCPADFFNK